MTDRIRGRGRAAGLLAATLVLALAASLPAGAAPPQKNDVSFSDTVACDGFTFDVDLEGRQTIMELGDDRLKIHENWHGSVVASTGTTARVHHAFTITFDFARGTFTITGLGFGTRIEKSSISHLDRGRLVLDLATGQPIFVAGSWAETFDPERATCELIAEAQS